jgi:hypothetical protein
MSNTETNHPQNLYLVKLKATIGESEKIIHKLVSSTSETDAVESAHLSECYCNVGEGAEWSGSTLYDCHGEIGYSLKGSIQIEAKDIDTIKKYFGC